MELVDDPKFESFRKRKLDGGDAFDKKQEPTVALLCRCGADRAACGACGQGWAQRAHLETDSDG